MKRYRATGGLRAGQAGLTLVETLVYAALSLAIMGLAVWSLAGLQKGAGRSQETARLHGDASEAMRLLAQDARNLGLKRIIYSPAPGSLVDTQLTRANFGPADSSSFRHSNGNPYDTLVFLKPALNPLGKPVAIDTVRYAADPATRILYRTLNGGAPLEICRQADALQFEYNVSAAKSELFDQNPPAALQWSQTPAGTVTPSGSALKASLAGAGTATFWLSGRPLSLNPSHTYQLDMRAMASAAFLANVDSIYAILCDAAGSPLARQSFLPAPTLTPLSLEWGGQACANCYCGFRMVMRGAGDFYLGSLKLTDVEQGDGPWVANPTPAQKKAVRAFRVYLLARGGKTTSSLRDGSLTLADVTVTFADKLARSLLEDIVPVPNNGY